MRNNEKMSDREYLKRKLKTRKMELEELIIEDRINTAKYNLRKDMISWDIDSLEKQLDKTVK